MGCCQDKDQTSDEQAREEVIEEGREGRTRHKKRVSGPGMGVGGAGVGGAPKGYRWAWIEQN